MDKMLENLSMRGKQGLSCLLFAAVVLSAAGGRTDPLPSHTNSIGVAFLLIPSGSFLMGQPAGSNNDESEMPEHRVTISKPFYLGKFPVTQAQWEAVMGNNPSRFKGASRPVEQVSWQDTQEFIQKLNNREKVALYRLPTEAEWEYAAHAGTHTAFFWGEDAQRAGEYAWYNANSGQETHAVGQKQPNAWGLHDMVGNVWEWVQDWYDEHYYSKSPASDPPGPSAGVSRVVRGGGWHRFTGSMRPTRRDFNRPGGKAPDQGFRLVREHR